MKHVLTGFATALALGGVATAIGIGESNRRLELGWRMPLARRQITSLGKMRLVMTPTLINDWTFRRLPMSSSNPPSIAPP